MDINEVLETIQAYVRRGAYQDAVSYADNLPPGIGRLPKVVLEQARAFLRQGNPAKAEITLACVDLVQATPGENLILDIETAALKIFRYVAIREALAEAQSAFGRIQNMSVSPAEMAEAERIHSRIILIAAIYHEASDKERDQARDRLPGIALQLEQAGQIDGALAAWLTYAEYLPTSEARMAAMTQVVDMAVMAGRPAFAGEVCVNKAKELFGREMPSPEILMLLDTATQYYGQVGHVHGLIDIQLLRAKLAIARELTTLDEMEACLNAYQQIDFYRGVLNVLMDLSQLAHEKGNISTAVSYRQQMMTLAESTGMGLIKDNFLTAQIDLLMRYHDYGAAIELSQTAIAGQPPLMTAAGYEQLLATAYSFIHDLNAACFHSRKALTLFEKAEAIDSASDAAMKLASDLSSFRQETTWDEATEVLEQWILKDKQRRDFSAAISKQEMLAQIAIERFFYSPGQAGNIELLDGAEAIIDAAVELTQHLPAREAALRHGNLTQLRGQICQGRGDEECVIRAWSDAFGIYQQAGLTREAANCHYILGAIFLNRANQELMPNFVESETHLQNALTYYDSAGMRGQAADTRFMIARLYANAAVRVSGEIHEQLLDAAVAHLLEGENRYDAIRREFNAGASIPEIQQGKHTLITKSQRIYELANEIFCLLRPDPAQVWSWVQKAKARSLTDLLGMGSTPPRRIMDELEQHPLSYGLVLQERELAVHINNAAPESRFALRQDMNKLWAKMVHDPQLAEYLELRQGHATTMSDLAEMMPPAMAASCICVDWLSVGDHLFMLTVRHGQEPQLTRIPLSLHTVGEFVANNLSVETFRLTLRDTPELLRELTPLITPLQEFCQPDELIIFVPAGPLHAIPFHALELGNAPLLVRNPVVYCPSLSVLRHCLERGNNRGIHRVALFGDPSGDRAAAAELVVHLGQMFGTTALFHDDVTCDAFKKTVAGCDLIHFQGHAEQNACEPLDSLLVFADGSLTAREIFALPDLGAGLVTLAACQSAVNVIAAGNEPLGLIPAFLYAGANSVLATLWKVAQTSAAQTMQHFYDMLTDSNTTIDKAQALRLAMLKVRDTPGFESPYHWAPFVLNGDWR
ncbi:MAG TPA: CHAT domain-containing protein [Candidatus Thiothrix moscowensis]|uniref:CHAT domain-containing protein n=1 Tax=Thiothrix sp. UBA2016 TaxID=1947695 RepID=UPI0025D91E5D|nr:CHAT domain-containing protein [Thiothrix sp. UBA2016]HRJ53058.1 CHAT domain-containing protein [Candidatus Thiothrix moscowensis]HRJ93049.1 CHAT domain-containing protein [Candidatus Thiothrix moscowensis]